MSELFDRLREERKRLKMSQRDFGALGGVSLDSQFNYESGERHPDSRYLAAIAAAGADVQYIITGVRSCSVPVLTSRAAALLDNYAHCEELDQAAIERMALLAAQQAGQSEIKRKEG